MGVSRKCLVKRLRPEPSYSQSPDASVGPASLWSRNANGIESEVPLDSTDGVHFTCELKSLVPGSLSCKFRKSDKWFFVGNTRNAADGKGNFNSLFFVTRNFEIFPVVSNQAFTASASHQPSNARCRPRSGAR